MNQAAQQLTDFLLRRKEVERITGISRSTIYRLVKSGKFPRPVILSTGSVRWRQSTVDFWMQSLTSKL